MDTLFCSGTIDRIRRQCTLTPDRPALHFRDQTWTYAELEQQAIQVAAALPSAGPETIVAVSLERSLHLVSTILGVWLQGAAYLPIDPEFPLERQQLMLTDAGAAILVTSRALAERFTDFAGPVVLIDALPEPENCAPVPVRSDTAAYVMYTSGSTGRPKGIVIEHGNLENFFEGMTEIIGPEPGVWMAVTSISFDISILELFWTLTTGYTVVLQGDSEKLALQNEYSIPRQIDRWQATHLQCTPSLARLLAADAGARRALGQLRKIFLGGEAFPADLVPVLRRTFSGELWNMYGPTETTIWSTVFQVGSENEVVPIGGPIRQTDLYVLDEAMRPVAQGQPGELFIGGAGVARGYLHRADLTAARFLNDPFRADGSRVYRTGDRVKMRADGVLEYQGRTDNQIKIRGHRIEPEEIEAVLLREPAVDAAAVVAREDVPGETRLIGYVVLNVPGSLPDIKRNLEQTLPAHMIPSAFVSLDQLPLTPNGKIDRRALPAPHRLEPAPANESEIEQLLVALWQEALGVATVSTQVNVLDLGADSLMIVDIATKLGEKLGAPVAITDFFQFTTIQSLAEHLRQSVTAQLPENPLETNRRAHARREALQRRTRVRETGL